MRWAALALFAAVWSAALVVPDTDSWARWLLLPPSATPLQAGRFELALRAASKVTHVLAYAVFAFLVLRLPAGWRLRLALLAVVSAHAIGGEWLQQLLPQRHPSWRDVCLDHLGLACGLVFTRASAARPLRG